MGKRAFIDRESSYRALVRDVILGTGAVVLLSLAVPAWIIGSEYRKAYWEPERPAPPVAEVLRDRGSASLTTPRRPPQILELAERIVRQEAERREAARREAVKREALRRAAAEREAARREADRREAEQRPAVSRPAKTTAPVAGTPAPSSPRFDRLESEQAP
ncbi:MAG TPA: hypothetical protein VFR64_17120 [Methylomirabilota bacterium]|nr:hypothetical protein [Methylomirabilota bacterium]